MTTVISRETYLIRRGIIRRMSNEEIKHLLTTEDKDLSEEKSWEQWKREYEH
jgi:hypothetical protein